VGGLGHPIFLMMGCVGFFFFSLADFMETKANACRDLQPLMPHVVALDDADDNVHNVATINFFWHHFQYFCDVIFVYHLRTPELLSPIISIG
jgi:hypothetical protein